MKSTKFIIACFCLLVFVGGALGQTTESSVSELQRVAQVLEKSATVLGYKTVRGYRPTDEWEAENKKVLIENHAYYTLFGEDSYGSCLSTNGRLGVTILIFKDTELARRQVDEMKKYHSDNMGVKVTKSDETGYFLEEVNGFSDAVIQGTKVIFFEDRSRAQADVVKSLVESVAKGLQLVKSKYERMQRKVSCFFVGSDAVIRLPADSIEGNIRSNIFVEAEIIPTY